MSKSHKNTSYKSEFSFLFFKDEHLSLNLLQLFLDFLRHGFFEASSDFQAQFLLKYQKKVLKNQAGKEWYPGNPEGISRDIDIPTFSLGMILNVGSRRQVCGIK